MKKIVFLCALLSAFSMTTADAWAKTAYVNTQTVFEKTKLGKKYQTIVKEYYEGRKKILDADAAEIQKLQETYNKQKQAKALNEKARKEKEEALKKKFTEFEKKREEFGNEIGKKNEELSNEFNQKMTVVLKEVAKKEKIALILSKNINLLGKAEVPAVLYAEEDLDITDRVISEMDKKEKE
ncbi:MAG: OmpH family outer membrane protein [Nitrospirota bacterium]